MAWGDGRWVGDPWSEESPSAVQRCYWFPEPKFEMSESPLGFNDLRPLIPERWHVRFFSHFPGVVWYWVFCLVFLFNILTFANFQGAGGASYNRTPWTWQTLWDTQACRTHWTPSGPRYVFKSEVPHTGLGVSKALSHSIRGQARPWLKSSFIFAIAGLLLDTALI